MVTETMVIIAIRQKNWAAAGDLAAQLKESKPEMQLIENAAGIADASPKAAYLLSLYAGLRWTEMNEVI
ncbi:hypothetical protein J5834_07600 [bacterium]|nr:hypothetical protein [bacterium]